MASLAKLTKINGVAVKTPHKFIVNRYNITKANRTTDGTMHMDLIAKKREFNFEYRVISGKELDRILEIIDTNEVFFTLEYIENGRAKSATVYAGAIPSEYYRGGEDESPEFYWENVNFNLIEQ